MQLDQQSINSFKKAYQKDYGIMLDDGEATEQANRLYVLMDAIYKGNRSFYKKMPVNYSFNNIK